MNEDHRRAQKGRWQGPSQKTDELETALITQWAERKGVIKANGNHDWQRLFGKDSGPMGAMLPEDDHVTMWRRHGGYVSAVR